MEYWGTRQQLRAGKVIADWIDKRHGNLDPIFGILLSPTAGIVSSRNILQIRKVRQRYVCLHT